MALKEQPYRLLVKHIYTVKKCSRTLGELSHVYLKGDFGRARKLAAEITKLEDHADEIRKEAVRRIPNSIFMAISKHNILLLLRGLDKLAHNIEYATTLLIARETKVTGKLAVRIATHIEAVVGAVNALDKAVLNVYKILKGELSKKEMKGIIDLVQDVIQHERRADEVHTKIIQMLYRSEGTMDDLAILHMLRAIEHIDKIANLAERTGIRLVSTITE